MLFSGNFASESKAFAPCWRMGIPGKRCPFRANASPALRSRLEAAMFLLQPWGRYAFIRASGD